MFSSLDHRILLGLTAGNLVVNAKEGSILVRIPAGEFEMGDGQDANCPKHKVWVDEYWIGVYCVTNAQYGRFVGETKHRLPEQAEQGEPVWKNGKCPRNRLNHPVVCVDWGDCSAYAKWAGLRLPTEAQWEKAARGPLGLIYPWGNEWEEKKCRSYSTGRNEKTAAVGKYSSGVSGYGTYQQAGNVWEWCADSYDENYYKTSPAKNPAGPARGSDRVFRGGSWWGAGPSRLRVAGRGGRHPTSRYDYRGFRLVRTA